MTGREPERHPDAYDYGEPWGPDNPAPGSAWDTRPVTAAAVAAAIFAEPFTTDPCAPGGSHDCRFRACACPGHAGVKPGARCAGLPTLTEALAPYLPSARRDEVRETLTAAYGPELTTEAAVTAVLADEAHRHDGGCTWASCGPHTADPEPAP
jgi:hypothetical protein